MGRDLVIGLSATFILWVGAVAFASLRLISRNWKFFRSWRQQKRETRVKMALWLAVPMFMIGILWMRGNVLLALAMGFQFSNFNIVQSLIYLPDILISLALMLWWAYDQTYGPELGDRLWRWLMWTGLGLSGGTWLASYLWS